ncbi:MAG: gas vesicle protein GvpO [Dehalococcoidia bacterium]
MVMKMADLATRAKEQLAEVTGFNPVAVVGSYKDEEGWHVAVDVLEMARLPESTDLLGTYVVTLDEKGDMVAFERKKTRLRGEPMIEEEEE